MDAHGSANEREYINGLIEKVIGGVYEVANVLGPGFLEKVGAGPGQGVATPRMETGRQRLLTPHLFASIRGSSF
jgi:hypothetical protein